MFLKYEINVEIVYFAFCGGLQITLPFSALSVMDVTSLWKLGTSSLKLLDTPGTILALFAR